MKWINDDDIIMTQCHDNDDDDNILNDFGEQISYFSWWAVYIVIWDELGR